MNVFNLSDKTYDFLKKLVTIVLPAISALYFGLAQIWGLPNAEAVVGTIALITVFLGSVIGISSSQYQKSGAGSHGDLMVLRNEDGDNVVVAFNEDPGPLKDGDELRFIVREFPDTTEGL